MTTNLPNQNLDTGIGINRFLLLGIH